MSSRRPFMPKMVTSPPIGKKERRKNGEKGRLPGAVGPENAEDLPFLNLEVDPLEGLLLSSSASPSRPEGLVDPLASIASAIFI